MTASPASPAANHFDARARDWDKRPISQQLADVAERLLARLELSAQAHVLDFGAGTGLLATAVAPRVAKVTALDTSAGMLQVLREKGVANIETVQQDIFAGLPGRFDAIVSCMALHHVADTAALLRVFADLLAPGGQIALVDLYAEDGSFHGDNAAKGVHHLGFEPEALQALARQAGLAQVAMQPLASIQRETGDYPLFLLTGRKPA